MQLTESLKVNSSRVDPTMLERDAAFLPPEGDDDTIMVEWATENASFFFLHSSISPRTHLGLQIGKPV